MTTQGTGGSAKALIDATIAELGRLARRDLGGCPSPHPLGDPDLVEEVKWVKPSNPAGVPTWTHDGIICTGEVYKDKVKLTFPQWCAVAGPERALQLQPWREHEARHRHP